MREDPRERVSWQLATALSKAAKHICLDLGKYILVVFIFHLFCGMSETRTWQEWYFSSLKAYYKIIPNPWAMPVGSVSLIWQSNDKAGYYN